MAFLKNLSSQFLEHGDILFLSNLHLKTKGKMCVSVHTKILILPSYTKLSDFSVYKGNYHIFQHTEIIFETIHHKLKVLFLHVFFFF